MTWHKVRLFATWLIVTPALGACAVRGSTPAEQTTNALFITGIAGTFLIVIVLVARWIAHRNWPPTQRGALVGFAFGLVIAAVVIRSVPLETQLIFIGALLGIGSDFLTTLKEPGGPKTTIDSAAKLVVSISRGIQGAAKDTGLEGPESEVVSSGLWAFSGTVLFTLIVGNLF